ncbi:MAG TPA: prepilin-type N-terminal cleavage/methylation domain-containing protein [Candidatus Saccharimonadales bacterium]|nr:prepilin-type N-terminal cleavage/methylation domain-containing protein [Candidatus Saccharimonadales bacterium]
MKNNQKGFSVTEILVVVVIIALLATIGWLVYDRQNSKPDNKQASTQTNQQEQAPTQPPAQPAKNEGFYEIKEWGIKIALTDYDKVQFSTKNESGKIFGDDPYEGRADPSFKPEFLQDKSSCSPGLTLFRSKVKFASASAQKQIGDYYYVATGGPGYCSNSTDNQFQYRFLRELSDPKNITAL